MTILWYYDIMILWYYDIVPLEYYNVLSCPLSCPGHCPVLSSVLFSLLSAFLSGKPKFCSTRVVETVEANLSGSKVKSVTERNAAEGFQDLDTTSGQKTNTQNLGKVQGKAGDARKIKKSNVNRLKRTRRKDDRKGVNSTRNCNSSDFQRLSCEGSLQEHKHAISSRTIRCLGGLK